MFVFRWMLALFLLTGTSGCSNEPILYEVTGTVTLDGQPVEDGQIIFVPLEEGGTPDAGSIQNGKFAFKSRPGPKKVEIQAMKQHPTKTVPDPVTGTRPALESYIPDRYNTKTELTADVLSNQEVIDFELTSKEAP